MDINKMTTGQLMDSTCTDWLQTDKTVGEYSNILAANPINDFKSDIKNHEKLLNHSFFVIKECRASKTRVIIHRLYIIRTVKEGPIFCTHPEFVHVESIEWKPNQTKMTKRIDSSKYINYDGNIYNGTLSTDYCEQYVRRGYVKYTVRLHSDDLLRDIVAKAVQVPSLARLCFSAIPTCDLKYYNDMNRV